MCGPNVIDDLRVKLQKRRAQKEERRDAEAASGSTMKLATHRKARRCLPEELFILFRKPRGLRIPGHKKDSVRVPKRAAGYLARSCSEIFGRVSTTRTSRPKWLNGSARRVQSRRRRRAALRLHSCARWLGNFCSNLPIQKPPSSSPTVSEWDLPQWAHSTGICRWWHSRRNRCQHAQDQRRHRRRGILLWAWASHHQYP